MKFLLNKHVISSGICPQSFSVTCGGGVGGGCRELFTLNSATIAQSHPQWLYKSDSLSHLCFLFKHSLWCNTKHIPQQENKKEEDRNNPLPLHPSLCSTLDFFYQLQNKRWTPEQFYMCLFHPPSSSRRVGFVAYKLTFKYNPDLLSFSCPCAYSLVV